MSTFGMGFDLVEYNRRADEFNAVIRGMNTGEIVADNITPEQLAAVRWTLANQVEMREVAPHPITRDRLFEVRDASPLIEGQDWVFATNPVTGLLSVNDVNTMSMEVPYMFHTFTADGTRKDFVTLEDLREAL